MKLDYLSLFQQRRAYLQSLASLACDQQHAIDAEDYAHLLELLSHKQAILGRFEEFSQRHPELVERWHADRDRISEDLRDCCEMVLEDMEIAIRELIEYEQLASQELGRRKFGMEENLQRISHGAQTHRAYHDEPVARSTLDLNR